MKSRPILFSAPMVRALLAGTKTQTRRIVKPQPPAGVDVRFAPIYCGPDVENDPRSVLAWRKPGWFEIEKHYCPYGQPGDRLWVRETIRRGDACARYAADGTPAPITDWKWKADYLPSIHMPRWTSRITLEITGVRVERLQGISEADAVAEGIRWHEGERAAVSDVQGFIGLTTRVGAFCERWESINGPGSWDANPWVWVVEFRRVAP